MIWKLLLIVFALFIAKFVYKFIKGLIKQNQIVSSKGGIKVMYKEIIDGLLEYQSARIIQESNTYIGISGIFYDPITNRECGIWVFKIQIAFAILTVKYHANVMLGGGEKIDKSWDFPINMVQSEILKVLKAKADETNIYGIIK